MSRRKNVSEQPACLPCELLESRRLLSTINWTNKGAGPGALDVDNFNATYGGNAAAARNIVQRAIDDWERVIVNFNYGLGGNTYNLNVSAADLGGGTRGSTGSLTVEPGTLKPNSADIVMDDNGGGSGWYFDLTPGTALIPDDSEFVTLTTAFQADGVVLGYDYYRTIVHEIGHAMGISSQSPRMSNAAVDIGDDPNDSGSARLFTLDVDGVPGADYTLTNGGGYHLYEGPAVGGNPIHPNDLMNSGRTAQIGRRQLITDANSTLLRDMYDYTVQLPRFINTFYANLNVDFNVLAVRGNPGAANDQLSINTSGGDILISVNNTLETISGAEFGTIFMNGGDGDDTLRVLGLGTSESTEINAGDGNDLIEIGNGDFDSNILSSIHVQGGAGDNTIVVNDLTDGAGSDVYTITQTSFRKLSNDTLTWDPNELDFFTLIASGQNDAINIDGAWSSIAYSISGSAGNDTLIAGGGDFDGGILGTVAFAGGAGFDQIVIDDVNDTQDETYQVSGNAFSKPGTATGTVVATSGVEAIVINGDSNNNLYSVPQLSSSLSLTINAGSGNDSLSGFFNNSFDNNLQSVLTFNGGGGNDRVTVNDQGAGGPDYFFDNNSFDKGGAGVINYSGCEAFIINCNAQDNDITILTTAGGCPVTVNGNSGNDHLFVNDGTSFLVNMLADITFNGAAGIDDQVQITDSLFIVGGTYTVTNGRVALPFNNADVFFSGAETVLVEGSQGANTINVNQTNVDVFALGGAGNDTINVGGGDFDTNITAGVLVVGDAGTDLAVIDDTLDPGSNTWTITNLSTTKDSGTGSVLTSFFGITIDSLRIDAGSGNSTFNINSTGSAATAMNVAVRGGDGNDTINVADGTFADMFGTIVVDGQGGNDAAFLNDTTDTGNDTYTLTDATLTKSDWTFSFVYFPIESVTLQANSGNNTINVNATAAGTDYRLHGNGGVDTFNINESIGPVGVDGGSGLDNLNVNDTSGAAQASIFSDQDFQSVIIRAGGLLSLQTGKYLLSTVSAQITGRFDLADGGFIDRAPAGESAYRTLLTTGYAGGAWNGPEASIFSNVAAGGASNDGLGYAFASEAGTSTFFGQPVAGGDFLIRYTLNGDNNLNGGVDLGDFAGLAANFNLPNTNWVRGNYNYDLITNIADFALQASNFNQSVPGDLPPRHAVFASTRIATIQRATASDLLTEPLFGEELD